MTQVEDPPTAYSPSPPPPLAAAGGVAELPDRLSARELLSRGQFVTMMILVTGAVAVAALRLAVGIGPSPIVWAQGAVDFVTVVYVAVIGFKTLLVVGAGRAPVLQFDEKDLTGQTSAGLPTYTLLVPLHREEKVLPELVKRLSGLDYPPERLQILLLIEEDDALTRKAADRLTLDKQFEVVLIPPGGPKTKPKACNVGLRMATGEFCVIYDAEDRPDPDQLRKAVLAFDSYPDWVVCVQAELQYWNPWTNWMTRCFAAEYALNFSLVLRGLDRFGLPIPLGGTSNHFRTDALRTLGGWDPYNVTEDADLGIRIARRGWSVRVMNSVTEEEANSRLGNWLRQRSRWIKGYYQTWLVHMRNPVKLWRELGTKQFVSFQLTLGFFSATALINPIFWLLTCVYLVNGPSHISVLFPGPVLYTGVATMTLGNLFMVYYMMLGCMERRLFSAVRSTLLVPLYWGLMSLAAYKALGQLLRPSKRHYWELTEHGLVEDV
jgi:glycosyltransferase XagB